MSTPAGPLIEGAVEAFRTDPAASGFVLDFDGTLSPIARSPEAARPAPGAGAVLGRLARRYGLVALLSGRRADDVHRLLPVPGVRYLGLYGAEEYGADQPGAAAVPEAPPAWVPPLAAAAQAFVEGNEALAGCRVEDKGRSVALHYRGALVPGAGDRVVAWAAEQATRLALDLRPGRMVVELAPPGPTKADAVEVLIRAAGLRRVLVAGDDVADVASARRAAALLGAGALRVGVASAESPPELLAGADLLVPTPQKLLDVLERFV